jgi:ketopantoate reductase
VKIAVFGSGAVGGYFGGRLELPWLSGAVVRMGRESGVATPVHQFITTALEPFVAGRGERESAG